MVFFYFAIICAGEWVYVTGDASVVGQRYKGQFVLGLPSGAGTEYYIGLSGGRPESFYDGDFVCIILASLLNILDSHPAVFFMIFLSSWYRRKFT
jgi:hypothetical protein